MIFGVANLLIPLMEALWPGRERERRLDYNRDITTANPGHPSGSFARSWWAGMTILFGPTALLAPPHRWLDVAFFYFPARWFAYLTDACQPRPPRRKKKLAYWGRVRLALE